MKSELIIRLSGINLYKNYNRRPESPQSLFDNLLSTVDLAEKMF